MKPSLKKKKPFINMKIHGQNIILGKKTCKKAFCEIYSVLLQFNNQNHLSFYVKFMLGPTTCL